MQMGDQGDVSGVFQNCLGNDERDMSTAHLGHPSAYSKDRKRVKIQGIWYSIKVLKTPLEKLVEQEVKALING